MMALLYVIIMTSSASNHSGSVYNLSNLFSWGPHSEGSSSQKSQRSQRSQSSMNSGHTNRLIHPERARLDTNHPNYYYNRHAIGESNGIVVEPSSTGNEPVVPVDPADAGPMSTTAQSRGETPSFFLEGLSAKSNSLASTAVEDTNVGGSGLSPVLEPPNLTVWQMYCKIITLPIPSKLLRWCSIATPIQELAWREKMGLNSIIFIISLLVGFCTFGLNNIMCTQSLARVHYDAVPRGTMVVHGSLINISSFTHVPIYSQSDGLHGLAVKNALRIYDGSLLFQNVNNYCLGQLQPKQESTVPLNDDGLAPWYFPCRALTLNGHFIKHPIQSRGPINNPYNHTAHIGYGIDNPAYGCHLSLEARQSFYSMRKFGDVFFTWEDLERFEKLHMRRLRVYHGHVVDLDRLELMRPNWHLSDSLEYLLNEPAEPQVDMSIRGSISTPIRRASMCVVELAKVGVIDTETLGCITSHVITSSAIALIVAIMICKFLCAVYYELFKTWQIDACANVPLPRKNIDSLTPSSTLASPIDKNRLLDISVLNRQERSAISQPALLTPGSMLSNTETTYLKYVICLVTVYSEGEKGLRRCLDSIALSDYPSSHLLIVVICDGYVVGAGNDRPTPEIIESMMETQSSNQGPFSYYSLGLAEKRQNMAYLSYGFYRHEIGNENQSSKRVPMLCITKCGNPDERVQENTRPGNRGKRDSQLILLRLLQRVMFNERMTDLENEICIALMKLMRIKPDTFEAVVMVDADTKVSSSSIRYFVSCLNRDPSIMGLCGETKIGNQNDSWVTRIQVFEYFISHHSTKSFESVFGGVTCLPGCFCMYRIKAPKGSQGFCVPLLANPDIVERYSLNNFDSVHANNLLLLGEDRYLTTLMLKTFPQRKQVFVSQAKCETLVPASFNVLLDQRRRWINSTIHNLLELLLVRDLCGVFCISMQFVVFVELIGTVTLPATTLFVVALLVMSAVKLTVPLVPLALLSLILGSSTLLIIFTGHRYTYLVWMLIYVLSLPIWNIVLPLNACKLHIE